MTTNDRLEQVKIEGNYLLDQVKRIIHEGNIRRIVVTHADGDVIAEFPLTLGVIGAVVAPVLAAIGAIGALIADCQIYIERADSTDPPPSARESPEVTTRPLETMEVGADSTTS